MEEGCLSLPGVLVDVERPVHVRVRAQDERGEAILIEASGLEARVIQHEMDHLDGVLILDRTSRDQRKEAMRTLRETARRAARRRPPDAARCAPSTSAPRRSPPPCSSGSPASAHRPALVVTRPDRPRGRGRTLQPPPVADAARALGLELIQPEALHAPEALERIAAAAPDALVVCAYGVLIREPLLSAPTRSSTCTRRCCRAGAARRRSSGRSWPATRRPASRSCASPRGSTPARSACRGASRSGPTTTTARSSARLQALSGELLVRALDERPPWRRAGRRRRHLRAQDRGRRPRARPDAHAAEEVERTVRALRPHIGARLPLPGRRASSACVAARVRTARRSRPPAAACAPTASGCCSTAAAARWSCSRSSRRAAGRCPPRPGCAAGRTRR